MTRSTNELILNPEQKTLLRTALAERTKKMANGCVLWTGAVNVRTGAPVMTLRGTFVSVTRAVFLVMKSKKASLGKETSVKTTCGYVNCLNPNHLVGVMARFQMLPVEDAVRRSKSFRASVAAQTGNALKPKAEKPKAEKPKAEKPKAEKPKAEKPKAEKPKAEKPKAEKPVEEIAAPVAEPVL